jgi:hypothetical protein
MTTVKAIYHALDLFDRPILAGLMQKQPLPPETLVLLKIVAGDEEALARAVRATGQPPQQIRQASVLYVQRILFAPDASCYRVLGAKRDAPQAELRERLAWLMRWLHPDRTGNDWESAFVQRVLAAWDALKTAERRHQYDQALARDAAAGGMTRARPSWVDRPAYGVPRIVAVPEGGAKRGRRRRIGMIALRCAVAIGVIVVPDWTVTQLPAMQAQSDVGIRAGLEPVTGMERPGHEPDGP